MNVCPTDFSPGGTTEMLLEIARFLASLAQYNPERDRYEIRGVVGPDEYHTAYPDSDRPGLDAVGLWGRCSVTSPR